MKIKVIDKSYEEVMALPSSRHALPERQSAFWRGFLKNLSKKELKAVHFSYEEVNMEKLDPDEPALFLMNHSCFTDLSIAATLLANRQYHIVMTDDGMVGKEPIMRKIGCISTKKFISDPILVKDMVYCVKKLNSSILMYPEASYSFDGTQTPLPESIGKLIKLLKVPVVMIRTHGAFLRDPLYNNLRKRDVTVTATEEYLLSKEEIASKSAAELNEAVTKHFTFDYFREQVKDGVTVSEPFRADDLDRVLYKCPKCGTEGKMLGHGTKIVCGKCGQKHKLLETGELKCLGGATHFHYVTDWYAWERDCVKWEIQNGLYTMDADVEILMLTDTKSMYRIGEGHLHHDASGFTLTGADGKLCYSQGPTHSYSLYADYYWYEIGDMICIGDAGARYYCFPREKVSVAKARLATEELYKMHFK